MLARWRGVVAIHRPGMRLAELAPGSHGLRSVRRTPRPLGDRQKRSVGWAGRASLLCLVACTAAGGETKTSIAYNRAAIVRQICRQYAASQTAVSVDTMYAQCMFARGYRVPGFVPSPNSPRYQGELPGPAAHNGGA